MRFIKLHYIIEILFLLYLVPSTYQNCNNSTKLSRQRRYLIFPNMARGGIRVNFKHNRVVPITMILAYSDGMRLTWDLPTKLKDFRPNYGIFGRRSVQKRDVVNFIKTALDSYGLNGEACVMRAMCETTINDISENNHTLGLLHKILHRIFHATSNDDVNLEMTDENRCNSKYWESCPLSLLYPYRINHKHNTLE